MIGRGFKKSHLLILIFKNKNEQLLHGFLHGLVPEQRFLHNSYSVFHRFGQAKFVNIVSISSPSQISILPQLRQKK
jgi:hypothetical protein